MSVSYVGIGTATQWSSSNSAQNVASPTHSVGDLLVLIVHNISTAPGGTPSTPSGWTKLDGTARITDSNGSDSSISTVFWKNATATNDTVSVTPNNNGSFAIAVVLAFSGHSSTTPFITGEWGFNTYSVTTASRTHPSKTPSLAGSALLLIRASEVSANRTFTVSPAGPSIVNQTASWTDLATATATGISGAQSYSTSTSSGTVLNSHCWTILIAPPGTNPVSLSGEVDSVSGIGGANLTTNHLQALSGEVDSVSSLPDATLTIHDQWILSGMVASSSGESAALDVHSKWILTGSSESDSELTGALFLKEPPPYADYQFFIDWNRDNGLRISDFETDYDGWMPTSILELTDEQSYSGAMSLKATWDAGEESTNPSTTFVFGSGTYGFDTGTFGSTGDDPADDPVTAITYSFSGLVPDDWYALSARIYVPPIGGQHVTVGVDGIGASSPTTEVGAWLDVTYDFQATDTTHLLAITATDDVVTGNVTYLDYIFLTQQFEDVTTQVRSTSAVEWSYGRDQSRALNPISPAETSFTLDNQDGRYSPNNSASPIAPYLLPNREVLVRATFRGHSYDLFRGFLDDIDVDPSTDNQSATFSAVDPLSILGGSPLSTPVHQGLRTGDAINVILDEIGWAQDRRDIDAGATVIDYFWVEGQDASDAIDDLVASEGPPAWAGVADSGYFIFRDRHHRILRTESDVVQATFNANGQEPCFSPPAQINVGWKDIINSVTFTIQQKVLNQFENDGTGEAPVVWSTDSTVSIPAGTSQDFTVNSDTGAFWDLQLPDANKGDYILNGGDGGSVQFSLDRRSGQTATLTVLAPTTDIALTGIKVRGYPIQTADGITITVENDASVDEVGQKADADSISAPWANANDALAIGQIITDQRGRRLPTISITVKNGHADRLLQMLERRVSDLIHIIEPRSYTDHDFFIESISHSIQDAGKYHEVVFGCEAVPQATAYDDPQTNPAFTFGDPQSGFDTGAFAFESATATDGVFILDVSKLDSGDGLGF